MVEGFGVLCQLPVLHQLVPVELAPGENKLELAKRQCAPDDAAGLDINLILSRLVDTFISKISLTMLPVPKPHNTACVLSWEEARRWQSRSSGYSSS